MRTLFASLALALLLTTTLGAAAFAQPGAIATNNLTGASLFDCTVLTDFGAFRQARILSGTSAANVSWEFPANCGFPGDVWRPYSAGSGAVAFNSILAPNGGTNTGALYNSSNGGSSGLLATTTNAVYYTFNIEDVSAGTNAYMQVLETGFNPVGITGVTQSPAVVGQNKPVTITITTSAAPASGESVYVRYSTDGFATSSLVKATFSGSTGTAVLPGFPSSGVVSYYVYSSNKTLAALQADVTASGERSHDLNTLNLNNNSGTNYSFVVRAALAGTYTIPGTYPTGYATLQDAIDSLNIFGVGTGGATFNLLAGNPQTAPVGGYAIRASGTSSDPITFTGNGNTITAGTPQVAAKQFDAVFKIIGGDYITLQGFTIAENAGNTVVTPASNTMTEFGILLVHASTTDGASNNTIQNNVITLNSTYPSSIGIFSTSASIDTNNANGHTGRDATTTAGTNSNNKVYGNTISNVAYGIGFICPPITATVFETGNDIGGTALATGNVITFGNATANSFSWNRAQTTQQSGIFFRNGAGINIRYNSITSSNLAYVGSTGLNGVLINSSAAPAGVTYTTTVSNNVINVSTTGTALVNGIEFGHGISTGTIVASNNRVTINQATTAAASGALTGIKANYASATNTITNDTVTVIQSPGTTGALTSAVTGINAAGAGTTVTVNNNILTFQQNAPGGTATYGSGAMTYIDVGASSGTVNVVSNRLLTTGSTIRSTGTAIGVNHTSGTISVGITIDQNVITLDRIAASGTISGTNESTTPSTVAHTITNNQITFTSLAGSTVANGILALGGVSATGTTKAINGNTISISGVHTGTSIGIQTGYSTGTMNTNSVTISCSAPTVVGLQATGTNAGAYTMTGNALSLTSAAASPTSMVGIQVGATGPFQIHANTFTTMSFTAVISASPTVSGISVAAGAGNNVYNNTVTNISVGTGASTGSPIVDGILVSGGTSTNVYKNKIYGITSAGSGTSGVVNGIRISGGTTNTVYNNLIGDLTAPASASVDALRGISVTSTTALSTNNVYFNTVYLSGTSTGANFGSSGIYHAANATPTTATLNLRNNIIANASTPVGTGLTVAFRRSVGTAGTLSNYAATSNNNDLFAGTPGPSNLIYSDGTSSAQTMSAYKNGVFTAGTVAPRDGASFSESPVFISTAGANPNFLHLSTSSPTQCESGALNIAGITDDYDGVVRQGNPGYTGTSLTGPDVGADEGDFVLVDLAGPAITYTALGNTHLTTDRILAAGIVDASGVQRSPAGQPVIYYKKSAAGSYQTATATEGPTGTFTFTLSTTALGGLVVGDSVYYYVAAQDSLGNASTNPSGSSPTIDPPNATVGSPNVYRILPSIPGGTYTIGATPGPALTPPGVFATVKAFFDSINASVVTGNLVGELISNTTETATASLNAVSYDGGGPYTITLRPASSTVDTISGSLATAILKLNGADNVVIDGSNSGGTDRSLTIINNSTGTSTATIWVASLGTGAGASNVTLKNLNIAAGSNTVTSTFGIFAGGASISTTGTGDDNDNLTIQNNAVTKAYYGIYARASATGVNNGLTITGNVIGSAVPADYIGKYGLDLTQASGAVVSQNQIFNIIGGSTNPTGMLIGTGFVNGSITRNKINSLRYTGTGGYGGKGIDINTGAASSNVTITNNVIYDLLGDGWTSLASDAIVGIRVLGTTGGLNIYYNTVHLVGTADKATSSTLSAAFYVPSGVTNIDVRNNIFSNGIVNSLTAGAKAYAIYNAGAATVFSTINNNDYYPSGTQGVLGFQTADQTTLTAWRTATGQDLASVSGNPQFVSPTDLHINPAVSSPVSNAGVPIAGITTDYDGDTRSLTTPDIGADEYTANPPAAFVLLTPANGATSVSTSGSLIWQASAYASAYDVYLDQNNPPTTVVSANQVDTTFDYTAFVTNANTYYWSVKAKNGNGTTDPTVTPFSFTTVSNPPAAPGNMLLVDVTADSLDVTWADSASNEDGYRVLRAAAIGGPYANISGDLPALAGTGLTGSYSDLTVSPNTEYFYRVIAFSTTQGESSPASEDTTTLARVPGAPVLSNAGYYSIKVTLTPNGNPAPTLFAVRVNGAQWLNTSGALVGAPVLATYAAFGGASGLTAAGLTPGTLYTVDVLAENADAIQTAYGSSAALSTLAPVAVFPYFEDFEDPPLAGERDGEAKGEAGVTEALMAGGAGWTTAIVSGTANDWVRATPAKTQLANAWSGTKAYITGATGTYANSQNAAVVSPLFNFSSFTSPPLVEFYHNWQMEVGWDAGVLEYTTNAGTTWLRVDSTVGTGATYNTASSTGWYNSSSGSGPISPRKWSDTSKTDYAGQVNGWIKSTTVIAGLQGLSAVQFRFRFGSDGTGVREGWAFDDFKVQENAFPPNPAAIVSPLDAATGVNVAATLNWASGGGSPTGYKLYFGTDNPPTNLVNGTDLGNVTTYDPPGNLAFTTTYYWRIVPYNGTGDATGTVVWSFTTQADPLVTTFPFVETFEDASTTRGNWFQVQELGTGLWTFATGSSGGAIATAYEGTKNARFVSQSPSGGGTPVTKLISPPMNLTLVTDPRMLFWFGQEEWSGDQNRTRVYYRISSSDPWVLMLEESTSVAAWTQRTLALPNPSAAYQVAFEGVNNWGRANVVDFVTVESTPSTDIGIAEFAGSSRPGLLNDRGEPSRPGREAKKDEEAVITGPSVAVSVRAMALTGNPKFEVIVFNNGSAVPSYQLGWLIDGAAQTPVNSVEGLDVGDFDTLLVTWTSPTPGPHTFRAYTILAGDTNPLNDSSSVLSFEVLPPEVIFSEGFNAYTFPPTDWTMVNNDGSTTDPIPWYRSASTGGVGSLPPQEGTAFAAGYFGSANGFLIDDWLITPNTGGAAPPGSFDSVSFWLTSRLSSSGNYPDSLEVLVSTTGTAVGDFTQSLGYVLAPKAAWTKFTFGLPVTANRYIAFRYLLYDGGPSGNNSDKVCLDNVQIFRTIVAQPAFAVAPAALNFGSVNVGNNAQLSVKVYNTGTAAMNVTSIAPDNALFLADVTSGTVAAGDSLTVQVTFTPTAAGAVSANLVFVHNAFGSPDTVTLSGTGVVVGPAPKFLSLTPTEVFDQDPLKPGKSLKAVKRAKPGKPILMPVWSNLLSEVVAQGGYRPGTTEGDSAGGMVIGRSYMFLANPLKNQWKVVKDSAAIHGWMRMSKWDFKKSIGKNYTDFQKTMYDKTLLFHDGPPSGLDFTTDGKNKPILKQNKKLTPKKHDNALLAELIALKVNIAASQLGKIPEGFGDLIFDVAGSPYDELTILQLSEVADSMMTLWSGVPQEAYDSLYSAVRNVNRAFQGPLDTVSFMQTDSLFPLGKLVLKGQVEITAVPYLRLPSPFVATRLAAASSEVEAEEDPFEDEEWEDLEGAPVAAKLYQNYPNPFNPGTTISFNLREESRVTIRVYDMLGRQVALLAAGEEMEEGLQSVVFDAGQLSSGVYFYQIDVESLGDLSLRTVTTSKMVLLK